MHRRLNRELLAPMLMGTYHVLSRIVEPYGTLSYSQEGEDLILRRLFEEQSCGFYVDVGAHHPQRFSNTFLFYKRGWRGVNIEPNPAAMELFRKMRPGDINLCVGVSDQPGTLTYIEFDDPALNTFDAELAAERERATPYRVVNRIGVPVARLRDLLEQHLPPGRHIDFMSIDVEGYDLEVVQSNDWEKYRPTYLLVECLESRLSSINEAPIHRFLVEQGYTLYAKTVNTLFYKDGSAP